MNQSKEFMYYAFISYSRKNSSAASYLHKGFERFKVPVQKVEATYLPPDKKYMRPIFRDKRDLEVSDQNFTGDIKNAIENSRYLVVLCSPQSAASKWVNDEVEYFLENHDNNFSLVVPIILSGTPGAGDETECLPPALRKEEITSRNLPRAIPDEGENEKDGLENGLVQAMSYMLHVKRENIKAAIDTERIHFYQRCAAVSVLVVLIFAALTLWAIRAEKKAKRNEKLAQMNAVEAKRQKDLAEQNAAEAKQQKDLAEQNAAEAKQQKDLAEQNAAEAKQQKDLAEQNAAEAKQQESTANNSLLFLRYMLFNANPNRKDGENKKVIDVINESISAIEKIDDKDWRFKAHIATTVGVILRSYGRYQEAHKLLKMSVKLYEKNDPETKNALQCYNNFGLVCRNMDNFKDALIYAEKTLKIQLKLDPEDHRSLINFYNNVALAYKGLGGKKKAEDYFEKSWKELNALIYATPLTDYISDLKTFLSIGGNQIERYRSIGDYHSAGGVAAGLGFLIMQYNQLKKIEKIEINHSVEYEFSLVYNNIGMLYLDTGDHKTALERFKRALKNEKRFRRDGNSHLCAFIYSNIAQCYQVLGRTENTNENFKKSAEYFQKSLSVRKNILTSNHPEIAYSYMAYGAALYLLKDFDNALDNLLECEKIIEQHQDKNKSAFAVCYNNIGEIYILQNDLNKAEPYFRKALKIIEKAQDDINHARIVYFGVGLFESQRGHYKDALIYYKKALEIIQKINKNHPDIKEYRKKLTEAEQKLKGSGQ